jgi:DNA-directed RNA polymerase specialized sigma subunit
LLIEIVEQLPETQLVVINAIYWERVSQGRLAVRLGISQQAIGRRHRRALERIRRAMNGGGP